MYLLIVESKTKIMKRFTILFFIISILFVGFSSCSKEEKEKTKETCKIVRVTGAEMKHGNSDGTVIKRDTFTEKYTKGSGFKSTIDNSRSTFCDQLTDLNPKLYTCSEDTVIDRNGSFRNWVNDDFIPNDPKDKNAGRAIKYFDCN